MLTWVPHTLILINRLFSIEMTRPCNPPPPLKVCIPQYRLSCIDQPSDASTVDLFVWSDDSVLLVLILNCSTNHNGDELGHFHYSNGQNIHLFPEGFAFISWKYLHFICFEENLRTINKIIEKSRRN